MRNRKNRLIQQNQQTTNQKKKIEEITKQLELQLTAHLAYLQRMKTKEQFVKFTMNPFNLTQRKTQQTSHIKTNKKRKMVNLMEGIQETKKRCNLTKIRERLTKVDSEMNRIHNCILNNRKKNKTQNIEVVLKPTEKQMKKVLNNKEFQFLDELVRRKQEKKLTLKTVDRHVNIFKLLPKRQDKCMLNCRQVLNNLYFCYNSMIHNPENKQGGKCMKQISLIARQFTTNQHHLIDNDYRLLSTDMIIKLDEIFFEEIMLVSTGVLEPSQLHKNLNSSAKRLDKNDDSAHLHRKQSVDEILYDQNHEHKSTFISYDLPDHLLRQKLMSYSLTPKEQQQMHLSIEVQKQLEELLKREETIKSYGINDQKLNRQIQKQRYDIMTMQIQRNADKEKDELEKDLDKKIRLSKLYKDRSEAIKTRFIQESVTGVKKHDKKIQSASLKKKKKQISSNIKQLASIKTQIVKNDQEEKQKKKQPARKYQYDTQILFSPKSKHQPRQTKSVSQRKSISPIKYRLDPRRSIQ